jgi:hypothetical protein
MKIDLLNVIPLPAALSLSVPAKWQSKEAGRDTFHFKIRLSSARTGQSMETDYSGGCLAFLSLPPLTEAPATDRERAELTRTRRAKESKLKAARAWVQSRKAAPPAGLYGYPSAIAAAFTLSTPDLHGVLYSLLSDAAAGNETFPDFCANYGYDEDSRKALEIYLKCQAIGADLRRVLGSDYTACESALADY